MNSCTPVFDVLADVNDLIDERKTIRSGASLFSDGEWIWRADSVHYLANYPLRIPPAFLEHVRSRNYQPPTDIDVSDPSFDDAISMYF